jgi:hypothetical protein
MKIVNAVIVLGLAFAAAGCNKKANHFELIVEEVNQLDGLVLKGLAISGTVKKGCIANDTELSIYRDNVKVVDNVARILSVSNQGNPKPPNGEALVKEFATLYLPGVELHEVVAGDVISSSVVSCRKTSLVKLK